MELTTEEIKKIRFTLSLNETKFHREKNRFEKFLKRHNSLPNTKIKKFKLGRFINKILERVKNNHKTQLERMRRDIIVLNVRLNQITYRNSFEV